MTTEKKLQTSEENVQPQTAQAKVGQIDASKPEMSLSESVKGLRTYGGFKLFTYFDKELDNMNPGLAAAKSAFLTESEWHEERISLMNKIQTILSVISGADTVSAMVSQATGKASQYRGNFNSNLKTALDRTRNLEKAYWNVALFFKNTGLPKLNCVEIVNVPNKEIKNLNDVVFYPAIEKWLTEGYHQFDMKDNYSLVVIPGWMGSKQAIDKWGEMVHKYKAFLLTDYRESDLESAYKILEKDNLAGSAAHLQHVLMFYNAPVMRKASEEVPGEAPMYASPASAVAGLMYNSETVPIAQSRAGVKYGRLKEVSGAMNNLLDFEAAKIDEKSLIPIILKSNSVYAWGNRTLFNGNNRGLQEYSIVRTFDWIGKVLMNFLTDQCFINFTTTLENDLRRDIISFLNDITGPGKLLENYALKDIMQDPKTKDIKININLTPFFAAKNFIVTITGHEGKQFDTESK